MNKELWDWGDEQQEQESQAPKRSLFDNLGDAITAIGANFSDVRGSNNIGDLRHELMERGSVMPLEEYNRKIAELEQLYGQREESRQQYQQAHDNLVADDSFLKNIDQLGGTLEGMAAQGIGTAVGAGLGLVGGVGGAAMGAKIGNAAGAVAGGYLDARSVALQAEEDVLDNGGTWEQARHAYDEALKKASLTTLPETLADIALGNRLVRAGLNSGMARKIAGSTIGRAGSAVLDPAARLGTKAAFKAGNTLVGRGVGLATDIAMQGSTEALQEVTQDYIGNRETAKALGQADNEYSLGGFKDYALSDQGLETMKTAGIMGALFGGAGGALSSGQYLTRGAETNTGIRAHNNAEQMINDGSLKISAEKRRDEEKIISVLKGISPAELASWSDAEIVAEASILEGQYMGVQGEAEDLSTVRGAADVVRRLSDENTGVHREGDLTETTNKFLERMGVDERQRESMFNSPAEMSIIEQARKAQETEVQAKTQAQEQEGTQKKNTPVTATLTEKTAKDMPKTEDGTITTKTDETQEQAQAPQTTTQPIATPKAVTETPSQKSAANHFEQAAKVQEQQGKITIEQQDYKDNIGGGWETDQDRLDESLDEHPYYNLKTGAEVTIKHRADGQYAVEGTSGESTVHPTLKDAEQYLKDHKDQTVFQGTNGEETEETKEGTVEDPNIVPKGGVNAKEGFSGQLISSVDDLYNFMLQNPNLISRGAFIEYVHAKHNIGFDNIDIYLDKKNEGRVYDSKTGKWGYVNAKKTRDEATGRAILQLYKGADFISAVHEIAHIGYDNLTAAEQRTFDKYAVKSMGQWIADMLDLNYDDAFKQRLNNLQNDQELQEKINKSPALKQTVIEFLNAEKNGIDLNNLTKKQREAIDERWAWEFSLWYTEGYVRGVQPKNVIERLLQRGCFSVIDELEGLHRLWEHIHHKDNNEIEDLYRNMGSNVERQTTEQTQETTTEQQPTETQSNNLPVVGLDINNFGGEQAIQLNVPILGESYNEARRRADYYNDALNKQWRIYNAMNAPSADGSIATNQQRPTNTENERTTTTGYKERTTSAAKNKREAEKLLKIIEGRKSGWEKALEKLAYVDPQRFRSVKVENGNNLWEGQSQQPTQQQEQQPNKLEVPSNGLNTGRPMYFNPVSEQTINKIEAVKKEQQEQRKELEKKRDLIEEKLNKAEDLFKRSAGDEKLRELLREIHLELLRYSAIKGFFENSYSLKESKYEEFIKRINKIEEELKNKQKQQEEQRKEQEKQKPAESKEEKESKKKIEYVNKNFTGVNGLSDSTKEVVYDAYKVLSTKGNNLITSLAKENAVLYARICDRIAKAYNENEGSNKYNAKDIYDRVSLKVSNRSNLTKRGSYSASEHHDRSGNRLIDLTKRVIKTFSQASPSTFLHETTHMYYWELELIASKYPNSQAAKDFKVLNDFANYKGEAEEKKYAQSLGETKGKTAELYIDRVEKEKDPDTKKYHMWVYRQEKIAQAFEEYLREGKSPNEELKSVFERFKDWILKFFGLTEQIGIKASPEVKAVFDRMVMTDEEIKQRSEEQQKTNKTEAPQNNQQTKTQTSQKKTAKKPTENVTPVVEQSEKQAKPTTPTDEIYSHLYFGDKTGKLKYNKDTKKIEYFVEEENGRDPVTMRRRYKLVNKGEITPEQYNELRLKYEQDFKKTKGEAKDRIPNLVEGMKKEDFMYSAYREIKQSEKEKGEVAVELGKEKQTLVTGKSEEYARQNAAEQSFNRAMSGEGLSGMEETELTKEDKEEAQKQIEQELPKVEKKKTEQTTTPKTSTTTTKKTTSTKTTTSKPKTTDPLSALHKKYKNITGTPIGEKGYVFKSDEKAFIEGFKGLIDGAVGNKEQLINVAKQLDSWFQNDPTERNRMVRKYLSQYLADAAQINANQNTEVRHQEANRTEQTQEILDKAFPNTRFQFAWHGSVHDFPEFTLDHLLSGEGAMAHGWGLYFGIDLIKNKSNYFDRFSRKNRSLKVYVDGEYDGGYEEFFDDVSYSNGYGSFNITKIKSAQDIINILQKEADAIREEISNYENDPDPDPDFREDMRSLRIDLKVTSDLLDYTIENKDKIEVKNEKDPKARYYFVEIPDNKYLLREGATFSEQPPFVQKRLIQAFCDIAPITEKDALTLFKTTDKKGFIPKNNNFYLKQNEKLKKNLYRFFIKELRKIDKENSGYLGIPNNNDMLEEYVSKLLNQYGIKGISYNGQLDGECAVIFDDKAIDIITKFRQEEGKWKSKKVDNARNREVDKQKAQRKLEKHRAKQNDTRFQLHSEEGLSKADTNSPEFKKWFEGSILTNKDGSPMVLYRGIDQHYSPEFDKEEGSIVWVTDDLEQAESYRDTQIDMEPTLNRKTGEFTGKPSMQREFLAKGAKKESGDLLEAYVSLKKPFNLGIVNDKKSPHDFYVEIGKQLQKDVKDGKITEQQMKSVLADLSYLNKKDAKGNYPTRSIENTKHFKKKFFNAFKKVGYDGVQGQEAGMFGDNRVNVYGVFDKGDIKSVYNIGTFDRNNKDVRYMFGGNQADNQTLLTPRLEKEYEKNFRNYMRLHGFSEAFIDKYFSNDKTGKEQMIPDNVLKGRNLFNKSFEEVFNEYNKQMVKDKGVKRGLDGRWRFEFSDKESKVDGKFVSNAFISKVVNDASKKYETTLQNVLKHDKLFEHYPELKEFKVIFATSKYDGLEDADGYSDYNEIAINVDSLKEEKNEKARLAGIRRTLLHEVQHQIQDREGFASGGGATRRELQDRQKDFVTSYINKLGGDVETGKKLINAIEDVIKNIKKVPRNKRGALYDKIRNNAEYFGDNERDFIRKHIKAIINGYINDYQNENKKFGNYINNEIKEMCEYLSLSKDLDMNEEFLKPIRQFRNIYWTTMGEIEARQTEQRADMTMEERAERPDVLDESFRKMKSLKDAPILVKETIPNIVDDEDTRFQESSKQQLSKREQQSKQILDKAFPDTRFQFAWHSTPHDFDAFTLDHLLEGEGMMAHGWGLYFAKDLQKNKKHYFDRFNKKKHKQLLFNGQDYSQQLEEMYIKAYDNWSAGREIRDIIEGYGSIEKLKESIDSSIHNAKHSLKSNKQFLKDITGENRSAFEQIFGNGYDRTVKGLEWSIDHDKTIISGLGKIQKILNDKNFEVKESSANILLVNIPEDNVLLREDAAFDKQPKYVQKQLLRMFTQTGRRSRKTGLTKNFINRLKNTTDIYGFVADYFGSEQDASLTLSEYGIKGISYRGEIDGECAVIFDADAINILNKFKQEEKKFVSQQKKDRENKQRQEELKNAAEKIEDILGIRFQESAKPLTDEEIEEMDKKEEAEYKKRQKRIEDAKDSATLSDDYKDVYSVAFTKSAQGYAENRTRMEYFDNNDRYWDRTEDKSTGKVTYTRKTPFEHHQQVVTYNGVNDVTREQKKKSKPRQWLEWMKDQLIKYMFNDKHYLAKAARKLGVYDAYRKMIVTEGYALKANTALTQGIKYNGKRTRALNDIIRDVGEENQKDFIDYCIAHRIIDLANRTRLEKVSKDDKDAILIDGKYYKRVAAPVFQKMKPDEARKIIADVKAGKNADMFEKNRKDFVEYNQALLHVLVEGGILTEKKFKEFCEVDPNFVPLAKVMDDADFGFSSIMAAHNLVNVETPIKKIGTSMREVANPFLEMQKRTAEYYSAAARNKAGQIFVNEIAEALDIKYDGNVVARGQQMINRVKVQEVNGEIITKPDDKKQIIYVCNNGEHQFYQIPDREIYEALRSLDSEQMGTIHKMLDRIAHVPSGLVRETATMVPDFGVRNLIRDGGEAFLTSEHGFLPVIDQIWGMWQVANNTEWAQMYFEQNGEYGTLNRDKVNAEGVASVEDVIDEKLNPLTNFNEIKKAQMAILKDKKRQFDILTDIKDGNFGDAWEHTRKSRGMAALKLAISPLWAIGKTNKRMNDLFELGTRVGEFKNAKMGFEGTLDRMAKGLLNTDIRQAKQSDIYSAHVAKDITLNFAQHGVLGKQLNRYIPFFNASLQGIYKLCNTIETMVTGTTMSGGKNRKLQQELLFKAALITAMAIGVASAGDGDEDYEEAPDYEKENFWILPNGLRFPKDQVLGKVIGNTVEKSYAQWKKGKAEPSDILRAIIDNFKPDKFMPAIFDLAIGGFGNYDTFRERAIVPEYMADKLGHLQKDISTSNFAVDVSEALWKCGFNISAKKIDWALQKNFSNCAKYATSIYDLGKKGFNPKDFNERIARGYDKNDSTGAFVAGLKDDVPNPINLVSGTFATNRSTFKSISDFYENYRKYKVLSSDEASMSKEDKRIWKRYEQAYKKDMTFRKQLRAIKQDKNLTGKQKREKADKIFKQQIKLAKWAEG